MKIIAMLLVAVAASAHARLASPFSRKALPPDESGYWMMITGNSWSHDVTSELTTFAEGQTRRGVSQSDGGANGLKSSPANKELKIGTGMLRSGSQHALPSASLSDSLP